MSEVTSTAAAHPIACPTLDKSDRAALRPLAGVCNFEDGQTVFRAGDPDLDLFVVEEGGLEAAGR